MARKATIKAILYKSKTYSNGNHPIYLRLTKDRKRTYRSVKGLTCHPNYWNDKKNEPRKSHPDRERLNKILSDTIQEYEEAQIELISEGRDITIDRILQKAEAPESKNRTVLEFYNKIIEELEARGKTGNLRHYKDVKKQLENFLASNKVRDILFSDIDYSFLTDWETYLRQRQVMETTLFAYLKNLRAVYNRAIKEGIAKAENYPFQEYKLSQFNTSTIKRAVSRGDIKAIESLDTSNELPRIIEAKQYALFSYYVFGINLTDMAYLRWADIDSNNVLSYRRQKTGEVITVELFPEALQIADYFRPLTGNGPYIFPIIDPEVHATAQSREDRINKVRTRTNKALKEIARKTGIEGNLTMYTMRHSLASHLHEKGAPASIIQSVLGHQTEAQTRTYLAGLNQKTVMDEVKKVLSE